MANAIGVDFETPYNSELGHTLKVQGMLPYALDPRSEAYLISVCDGANCWAGQPKNFNWDSLQGQTLCSHNAYFDSAVQQNLVNLGKAPKLNLNGWHCTASLSTYMCMRRDLARASEHLLNIKVVKDVRGSADGKKWDDLIAEDGGKSMLDYARKDAYYCWLLWDKYSDTWPEFERRLSNLTTRQGQRGVQLDVDRLNRYIFLAQEMLIQAELDLPWMKEGKAPTSPKAIAEECRKNGIPCPPVKAHDGEEAFDQWAANYGPRFTWVAAFTNYRLLNKLLATLQTLKNRKSNDGIFPFELLYFGAHTGRWAGAGGFNMQNMRKEPYYRGVDGRLITDPALLKFIDEEIMKTGAVPSSLVSDVIDIRSLFVARPGKKLIISDLSQIEARVLAWLAGDTKMLELMARGISPYESHAIASMGWTGGNLKKENKELYALAKARVLGLGFQCAWKKFITVAQNMAGLDITKDDPEFEQAVNDEGEPCFDKDGKPILVSGYGKFSREVVAAYRRDNPLIVEVWKTLDEGFKGSVGSDFEITLPSGRKLRYPDVRKERKLADDPDNPGKMKMKWATTALAFDQKRNNVVRKPFYGGLLAENATQATARDVFGERLLELDSTSGIDVVFHAHDESVNEADLDVTAEDVNQIMSKAPAWMPGLPVGAETIEALHYKK